MKQKCPFYIFGTLEAFFNILQKIGHRVSWMLSNGKPNEKVQCSISGLLCYKNGYFCSFLYTKSLFFL